VLPVRRNRPAGHRHGRPSPTARLVASPPADTGRPPARQSRFEQRLGSRAPRQAPVGVRRGHREQWGALAWAPRAPHGRTHPLV